MAVEPETYKACYNFMQSEQINPVIIIGAGRSGTNILRDVLTSFPGMGTWPCDEINYIWRHGNKEFPTDEFDASMASPQVRDYIRNQFRKIKQKYNFSQIIEKTCANSLRVGFVDAVVPEAKYIVIVRDGRDVVASALKRWSAPLDIPYIMRKARFIPPSDVPYYAFRYLGNRAYRLVSREKRLSTWGPRFEDMEKMLENRSLPEVCARQWERCVNRAEAELFEFGQDKVFFVYYEDFVRNPSVVLQDLEAFLNTSFDRKIVQRAVENVTPDTIGKWKTELTSETLDNIMPYISETLERQGYHV